MNSRVILVRAIHFFIALTFIILPVFSETKLSTQSDSISETKKSTEANMEEDPTSGIFDFGRHTRIPFHYSVSSGSLGNYQVRNLFDSNIKTSWMSDKNSEPEWIIVDFYEKRLMDSVEVHFPSWGFFRKIGGYQIQVNVWGKWQTLVENPNPKRYNKHKFPGIDASMIRVFFPDVDDSPVVVSDFKIFLENSLLNGMDPRLGGFLFPVDSGILPNDDYSLPGAPRAYRNGFHKGVDIRTIRSGFFTDEKPIDKNTDILNCADGIVLRADWDYIPMIPADFEKQKLLTSKHPVTFVDRDFGGRQVWIDHGNGILTAYNHLSSIDPNIQVGKAIKKGIRIGKAGNSGLKGEADKTNEGIHLHLEIWVDGEYLGKGLSAKQSRQVMEYLFRD